MKIFTNFAGENTRKYVTIQEKMYEIKNSENGYKPQKYRK